jgi:hypothetical protein
MRLWALKRIGNLKVMTGKNGGLIKVHRIIE